MGCTFCSFRLEQLWVWRIWAKVTNWSESDKPSKCFHLRPDGRTSRFSKPHGSVGKANMSEAAIPKMLTSRMLPHSSHPGLACLINVYHAGNSTESTLDGHHVVTATPYDTDVLLALTNPLFLHFQTFPRAYFLSASLSFLVPMSSAAVIFLNNSP